MAYRISITQDAEEQLRSLPVRDQRIIEAAVTTRLSELPTVPTKSIKRLRPNPLAEFELRVRDFRVLYNVEVDKAEIVLLIVGRKVGNSLIVAGEEFHGHRSDPSESAPDGPETSAD